MKSNKHFYGIFLLVILSCCFFSCNKTVNDSAYISKLDIVDGMIKNKGEEVKVLTTDDRWYGVTYKEDVEPVKAAIKKLVNEGLYEKL